MFWTQCVNKNWVIVLPMLLILVLCLPVYLVFGEDVAWILGNMGTGVVYFGVMIYIIFFDSKKRWPTLTCFERMGRLLRFER